MKQRSIHASRSKLLSILVALTILAGALQAQTTLTVPGPSIPTFQRLYTLPYQEQAYAMEQTADSGFVIAGQVISTSMPFIFDSYITRLDKWGNTIWSRGVGPAGFTIERAEDVHQTSDGGFIVSGGSTSDMLLYKMDAAGNLEWGRNLGDFFAVNAGETAGRVVETSDGGFIVAGNSDSIGSVYHSLISLVKVDSLGNNVWQKHYASHVTDSIKQWPGSIIATSDGNYAISGATTTGSSPADLILFKIDPNGDTLWTKTYDIGTGESNRNLRQTADGGYILHGTYQSAAEGAYLLKVDSLGNAQWAKTYIRPGYQAGGYLVDEAPGGGYYIGGYTGNVAAQWNYYLIRTDAAGDTLWTRRYGQSPNNPSVAWAGQVTNDGGFVLTGSAGVIGNPTNTDLYLIKTDSAGNSGCFEQAYPLNVATLPIITSARPYLQYTSNVTLNVPYVASNYTATDAVVCCHVPLELTGIDTVCTGDSVTLFASGAHSYVWSNGATTPSVTVGVPVDTSFTVFGFIGPGFGCNLLTMNVQAVDVTPVMSGNNTICSGNSTTLSASGGNAFQWSTGATTSSITVSPATTTTYTVAISIGSCTVNDSITVTVNQTPTASVTGNDTICAGDSTVLTASGGGTYQWNTGETSSVLVASPATTTTYTVIVSSGQCADTTSFNVVVNQPPAVNITGTTNICAGDSTTLTASGTGAFQWSTGGTASSVTVNPGSTATYSVTLTAPTGCTNTASITVNVTPLPNAVISGNLSVCSGSSTTLTASGGSAFAWSTGATSAGVTVSPTASTTYSVIVSNGSCSDTATANVTVLAPPAVVASADDTVFIGNSTTISVSGTGVSYQWTPSGGLSCTNCQSPAAAPTQTTTYCATVTDANGCSSTDCVTIYVDATCGQLFVPNAFSPNSDLQNDELRIYGRECIESMTFIIYNRWGEKVFETADPEAYWDGMFRGELMNPNVFVYHLQATMLNGDVITKKGNITLVR